MNFDADWLFNAGERGGEESNEFDDSAWRRLNLPHDWSIEGDYERANASGRKQGFLPTGVVWYRKHFSAPARREDSIVSIDFDGAYHNARVYLNGELLGERPYGYIPFSFAMTHLLTDGDNCLAVRLDTAAAPNGRWYAGTGIYRHVSLRVQQGLRIEKDGIFVRQRRVAATAVTKGSVEADAEIEIAADQNRDRSADVRVRLFAPDGVAVFDTTVSIRIAAGGKQTAIVPFSLEDARLWTVDDPYVYTVRVELFDGREIADTRTIATGFRAIRFDPDHGFFLNDEPLKFKGVCLHQDAGPFGAAVPDGICERRLVMLKRMGCNAVRTAHHPFAAEFYEQCDRLGLMVMDEIFDGWHEKAEADYGKTSFAAWWKQDVADWVRRDRNHPSIIVWSIGNETGNDDINGIAAAIRALDDSRPITGGDVQFGVDLAGFNGKGGQPGVLEKFHADNPRIPIVLTEKPHTYQTRGFYRVKTWWRDFNNPRFDIPDLAEREIFFDDYAERHPYTITYNSSYDNSTVRMSARFSWRRTSSTPWIAGEFRWTGFDYLGESFGWPLRSGNHGIIDFAGFPKDHFFLYKSMWSDTPTVHLLPHWTHPGKEGMVIPVVCYTNGDSAELFLNGRSRGEKPMTEEAQIVWQVPYEAGTLKVKAKRDGSIIAEAEMKTAEDPVSLIIESDLGTLPSDGNDAVRVAVAAQDKGGTVVPDARNRVCFFAEGPGRLAGLENGDPADLENHRVGQVDGTRKLFAGRCAAFVRADRHSAKIDKATGRRIIVYAAAILGRKKFIDRTSITIDVRRIAIPLDEGVGEISSVSSEIRVVRKECVPGSASAAVAAERYEGSFIVSASTEIQAFISIPRENGSAPIEMRLVERFDPADSRAAPNESETEDNPYPLSPNLVGTWVDTNGKVFRFEADGVLFIETGVVTGRHSWWYQDPNDIFEDRYSDADNGRVIYQFRDAGLKIIDGKLRLRDHDGDSFLVRE